MPINKSILSRYSFQIFIEIQVLPPWSNGYSARLQTKRSPVLILVPTKIFFSRKFQNTWFPLFHDSVSGINFVNSRYFGILTKKKCQKQINVKKKFFFFGKNSFFLFSFLTYIARTTDYGRLVRKLPQIKKNPRQGIEPGPPAWQTGLLTTRPRDIM